MAKLTTVTSGTDDHSQDGQTAHAPVTDIDINELANTADVPTVSEASNLPSGGDDAPLLDDDLLFQADDGNPPQRSAPLKDITKNPVANTLAITLLSFGIIGGLAFIWWGISAAQNRVKLAGETESLEDIVEDEKQKEIEQLQQQLYEQRANVALKDLNAQEIEPEDNTAEDLDGNEDTDSPTVATAPTPPPRSSTPPPPPPPPRRVTPTPVRSSNSRPNTTSPSTPIQPNYDSPDQWYALAALGQIGTTDFEPDTLPPPSSTIATELEAIATEPEEPVVPHTQDGWGSTGLAVVTVNTSHNNPWPSVDQKEGKISQGERGILDRQPIDPLTGTPYPTNQNADSAALLSSAKRAEESPPIYESDTDTEELLYVEPAPFIAQDIDMGTLTTATGSNEASEDQQVTTVAIGTITKAKVITPIIWDMEAPRATDGIFAIELTEPMQDINGEIVLPEGTRLIGDVSHVTSVGHVYQSIIAIHLPNGQQIPIPVIDHETETGAPITPLVVRGKKGEALIADPVERSDTNRNSLGNDVLIGVVNGLADAADNALEPDTSVQVNQGSGGSTVESQNNVTDPTAAFARGFLESTAQRMEERLDEDTEDILVFQVDASEKVSVVVNGLMRFNIPARGW
ncbi:MAG: hypothetical protein AAGD25_15180 [Cyanobacteria bacterium P01_F01_bin.150]